MVSILRRGVGRLALARWGLSLLLMGLLNACGGGGGGGSSAPPKPALTLSTSQLSASVAHRERAFLYFQATVTDPNAFGNGPVYVFVVDPTGLLEGGVSINQVDAKTFSASLTTKYLAPGSYQGSWQLRICKDPSCATEYPGSPMTLGYDIKVAHGPLSLSSSTPEGLVAYAGDSVKRVFDLRVNATSAWTVSSDVPWLQLANTSGSGNSQIRVTLDTTGMAVGEHKGDLIVTGSDGQKVAKPFAVTIQSNKLSSNAQQVFWSGVNGNSLASTTLSLMALGSSPIPWLATASAPWIQLQSSSGQTPGALTLLANLSNLASGVYNGSVTITAQGLAQALTLPVTLQLSTATLTPSSTAVVIGGADGRKLQDAQTLSLSLNTGTVSWPWKVKEAPDWLQISQTSGTTSATPAVLTLGLKRELLQPGSTKGQLKLEAQVAGDLISSSVELTAQVDQRRLLASSWGVGLSSSPNGQVLQRTLSVRSNFGGKLNWTASSSESWLQVSASGDTEAGGDLVLRADPASLADKSMNYATVTFRTTEPGVEPARVRVGLWKDSTGLAVERRLSDRYTFVQADPIRPHVYLHDGGSSVDVFHAYSGQKLRSFSNLGGALANMTVDPDGGRLFVLDSANRRAAVVNLDSNTVLTPWALASSVTNATVPLAVMVDGVSVLLMGDGHAVREGQLQSGMTLGSWAGSIAASSDGKVLVSHVQGMSPSSTYRYGLKFSAVNGGSLFLSRLAENWNMGGAGNGQDVAVSLDGETTITASGAPYACPRGDAQLNLIGMLPGGDAYPNNAEVLSDGRWVCGASVWYGAKDVWVYSQDGVLEETFRIGSDVRGILSRQLVATPDGRILIGLSEEPKQVFQPLRPR